MNAAGPAPGWVRSALAFTPEFFDPQVFTNVLGMVPQLKEAHAADPDALMSAIHAAVRGASFEALNGLITPPPYEPGDPDQSPAGIEELRQRA